jgi:hypothetical protein
MCMGPETAPPPHRALCCGTPQSPRRGGGSRGRGRCRVGPGGSRGCLASHEYETTSHRAWPPRNSATRCRHRSGRRGPATPLAVCRCAGGPSGSVAMTGSVPCRYRLPTIAWVSCSRHRRPPPACPACGALGRVTGQGGCGRWWYARAVPYVKDSAGHPAEKGEVPAPSRTAGRRPPHAVRAREGCAITSGGYHHW